MWIEAEPHWGGDVELFASALNMRVRYKVDAAALAKIHRLLRDGGPEALRELAEAAERIEAGRSDAAQIVGC